jgi:hypothetical protein
MTSHEQCCGAQQYVDLTCKLSLDSKCFARELASSIEVSLSFTASDKAMGHSTSLVST